MTYFESVEKLDEAMSLSNSEAVYILKPNIFLHEYDSLLKSFKHYYNRSNIAYSFKTNYIPDLLNIVKNKGGYAEVVSIMELQLALEIGFEPTRIFFNGPFKHRQQTVEYLRQGVLVNVDSLDEFMWINTVANEEKIHCRIGIRLNFNFSKNSSRFGIDINSHEITSILNEVYNSTYVSLESLHYHYAARDIKTWSECTYAFISFISSFDQAILHNIRYISLGGGIFSDMSPYLKEQIGNKIPTFADYAENSIKLLSSFLDRSEVNLSKKTEVLIEPGTALAAKAIDFVVKVVSIKKIGGVTYINTTGSKYNMNPSPNRINSPTRLLNLSANAVTDVRNGKICGYTCIESDIIHDNFSGALSKGDLLIFEEVGAYSIVMKPPFILPDVAILEYDEKQEVFLKRRRRQTFKDIFENFTFFSKI